MDEGYMKRLNTILILTVIILSVILWQQQRNARQLVSEMDNVIDSLQTEGDSLKKTYIILTNELDNVRKSNISLQSKYDNSKYLNAQLREENKRIRDSLLNIPYNSVYARMEEIKPAVLPREYSFDGPQVHFWYTAYIDNQFNVKSLKSAENELFDCDGLVKGLRAENNLINSQNGNLGKQLTIADNQLGLYQNKTVSLQRDNKRLKTEKRVWQVVSGLVGIVAIIK
jgi:chromosome segregation ATPase